MISSKLIPPRPGLRKSQPAARIAEIEMAGENPGLAVQPGDRVLHVAVIDPIGEGANELDGIDSLPMQMAGVEIEAEFLAVVQRLESPFGRIEVKGDFRGVNFQGELHAAFAKHVENRIEAFGEQLETGIQHLRGHGRKRIIEMPDARAGESVYDADAELLGGRAVFFSSSAARALTPAGSPSPQT